MVYCYNFQNSSVGLALVRVVWVIALILTAIKFGMMNWEDLSKKTLNIQKHAASIDDGRILIHTYHEGKLFPNYDIIFDSFLLTQNLKKVKLVQWSVDSWATSHEEMKNKIFEKYNKHKSILFQILNLQSLMLHTCFENRTEITLKDPEKPEEYYVGVRELADVIRILLLQKYGGIWVDSDTVFLLDLSHLYEVTKGNIVAGFSEDIHSNKNEDGIFNNNVLVNSDKEMRDKLLEVACEFRRILHRKDDYFEEEIIRPYTKDGKKVKTVNNWIYNDGTLRWCWIRDDCKIELIDLGEFDPAWMKTNDLIHSCELTYDTLWLYTRDYAALLKSKPWKLGTMEYLVDSDWRQNVWVFHSRLSHCRLESMYGIDNVFKKMIDNLMGTMTLQTIPDLPLDFITFDRYETKKKHWQLQSYKIIILMKSEAESLDRRMTLRSISENYIWGKMFVMFPEQHHKLIFLIEYTGDKSVDSRLITELTMYEDIIIVDESSRKTTESSAFQKSFLSKTFTKGILKLLNGFQFLYLVILPNDTTFVNVYNLYRLIEKSTPEGMRSRSESQFHILLVDKNCTESKMDVSCENILNPKNRNIREMHGRMPPPYNAVYVKKQQHNVIIASQPLLSLLLNINTTDIMKYFSAEDMIHEFKVTDPPDTLNEASIRLGVSDDNPNRFLSEENLDGILVANTIDQYGFYSQKIGCHQYNITQSKAETILCGPADRNDLFYWQVTDNSIFQQLTTSIFFLHSDVIEHFT